MSVLGFIRHRAIAGIRDEGGVLPATRKALSLLIGGGLRNLILGEAYVPGVTYGEWVQRFDTIDESGHARILEMIEGIEEPPGFSVLLPVFNTPKAMLQEAIDSVINQIYPHWELCIADDASSEPSVRELLERAAKHPRVRIKYRELNGHISAASNSALELATEDWVIALDHDDVLAPDALYACAREIADNPTLRMIYSDEDKLDGRGHRVRPYFKPDFNRELLRGNNYICHLACYRRDEIRELGGYREGFEGAQDHDLALRYSERLSGGEICHIPKILYHWREHSGSTAVGVGVKDYALKAGARAVEEHLERVNLTASVKANSRGYYEVRYRIPVEPPSVTILIPTRDSLGFLKTCVESIKSLTDYPNYTILIVDNGSTCPETLAWLRDESASGTISVRRDSRPFNYAALNNLGVEAADSKYVLLLNNDTEVISRHWLSEMVSTAAQADVGAVGAKLLYKDESIQHCGVIVGIGGSAGHAFKGHPKRGLGYYFRAAIRSEFSAVTGACLLVRRDLYRSAGGLDERCFKVAFNDIDFCLRLHSQGFRNIVCPDALLFHYESKSRGYEDTPQKAARFAAERACLRQRWLPYIEEDPAYNPHLTRDDEHFSHERRFAPGRPDENLHHAGDDDFDGLASLRLGLSPALILLLKRLCAPPDRSVGMVLVGVRAKFIADELLRLRPSIRLGVIDARSVATNSSDEEGSSHSARKIIDIPYPVDLVIKLDDALALPPHIARQIDVVQRSGAIVHTEMEYCS
ncbi:MAG: glycosyltransferase family 2 protein [Pseudomonadota bacterium]